MGHTLFMSIVKVSSESNETIVSPPCESSSAFGGRKRATTLIAELLLVSLLRVYLIVTEWETARGSGDDQTRWGGTGFHSEAARESIDPSAV
jgi:hypothetical protein